MALPRVPGSRTITALTGNELVGIAGAGPQAFQTTTGAIAALGLAIGTAYFVNETTGSDGNNGSRTAPFATLGKAQAAVVANHGDVIYIQGTVHIAATFVPAKDGVTYVGINAPSTNDRARISQTGAVAFSPLVDVTAQGCAFVNLATFHGFDDASTQICWTDAGGRNYYGGVDFLGMGHATAAAQAGSRSLLLSGATGENLFEGCRIGSDTVLRATNANASLEAVGGSPRNIFRGCTFAALCSDVADVHVLVGADGIDRWMIFDDCQFIECVDSGGSTLSAAISANAAAGGSLLLNACISLGATAVATAGPVYVNQISAAGGATTYVAIKAT